MSHDDSAADVASDLPELRELAEAVSAGVLLLDVDGRVAWANSAETSRWLVTGGLRGRDLFRELIPMLEHDGLGAEFRARAPGGGVDIDSEVVLAGGVERRHVRVLIRSTPPLVGPSALAVLEDRTELVRERARRRDAERLAAVGERAAGLPHEINNPLAAIRGFAQLLARTASDPAETEALRLIVVEADRIGATMNGLLSMMRREGAAGYRQVELNQTVRQVVEMQRYALSSVEIEVRCDLQEGVSPVVAERGTLLQVVLDLVLAAERALLQRASGRLLVIRTREASTGVMLTVFDNGPGIARHRLATLFAPDREAGDLGLSVIAGIVRDLDGELTVESEEGRNTTVVVTLPRASGGPAPATELPPTATPLAPTSQPGPVAQPVAPPPATDGAGPPLRVLVADDEPTLRLAISMFLERRGHHVVAVEDAHQAWTVANEAAFDVALVDARMPGDGLLLLERLEQLPALAGRTALMTGDVGRERTTQGIATGRPCLTKPFDMHAMVRLVETLGARDAREG